MLFLVLEDDGLVTAIWLASQRRRAFIIWMVVYRVELPQGAFLSALLKATFCRDPSDEKRFLF